MSIHIRQVAPETCLSASFLSTLKKPWELIMKVFDKRVVIVWHSSFFLLLRLTQDMLCTFRKFRKQKHMATQYAYTTPTTPNLYCIDSTYTIYNFFIQTTNLTFSQFVIGREPPTTWLVKRWVNALLKGTTRTKTADFSNW